MATLFVLFCVFSASLKKGDAAADLVCLLFLIAWLREVWLSF